MSKRYTTTHFQTDINRPDIPDFHAYTTLEASRHSLCCLAMMLVDKFPDFAKCEEWIRSTGLQFQAERDKMKAALDKRFDLWKNSSQ